MKEYYSKEEMLAAIETGEFDDGDHFAIEGGFFNGYISSIENDDIIVKRLCKDHAITIREFVQCKRFKYIKENEDIDIQKIDEVPNMSINNDVTPAVIALYKTTNQLVKAVKKLDKKILN